MSQLPQATPMARDNGTETSTSVPSCPLASLPESTHQYIHQLEERISVAEAKLTRFETALINAGRFIFENPMSKPMLAVFPKDVQNQLREFFGKPL